MYTHMVAAVDFGLQLPPQSGKSLLMILSCNGGRVGMLLLCLTHRTTRTGFLYVVSSV
jgi:hypothetical protein